MAAMTTRELVAELAGLGVTYWNVIDAIRGNKIPAPPRFGRAWAWAPEHVQAARDYFAGRAPAKRTSLPAREVRV